MISANSRLWSQNVATEKYNIPSNGYVPDKKTACTIAQAICIPIYGEATIKQELPFEAKLSHSVWIVTGSYKKNPKAFGGTAIVEISKKDGRIISVIHGK